MQSPWSALHSIRCWIHHSQQCIPLPLLGPPHLFPARERWHRHPHSSLRSGWVWLGSKLGFLSRLPGRRDPWNAQRRPFIQRVRQNRLHHAGLSLDLHLDLQKYSQGTHLAVCRFLSPQPRLNYRNNTAKWGRAEQTEFWRRKERRGVCDWGTDNQL